MSLNTVRFSINDQPSDLQNIVIIQGDTLKISARIPLTSLSAEVLPVVTFFATDSLNLPESVQLIGPKNFTVTLNTTLTTADISLILSSEDTESLILDQTLGQALEMGQMNMADSTWYQPAKKLFLEIQLTALGINKTWQGNMVVKGDLFKTNTTGTLPGIT